MEMLLIKEDSNEWQYIWNWLAEHPLNDGLDNPSEAENELNGEKWQYVGSFREDMRIVHTLRHRSHPKDNDRYMLNLSASDEITGEDILKEFKIN